MDFLSTNRNRQSGFSLIQVLLSVALLGAVSAALLHVGKINALRVTSETRDACEILARASMDRLRSIGLETGMADVDYRQNQIQFDSGKADVKVVGQRELWPRSERVALLVEPGAPGANPAQYTRNNHLILIGGISALAGIYQSNRGYCTDPLGLPYEGGDEPLMVEHTVTQRLKNVGQRIRIQRYDLNTGETDCNDNYPAPRGDWPTEDPPTNPMVTSPPDVSYNHGFLVTLTVTHDSDELADQNGVGLAQERCATSSVFQYPIVPTDADINNIQAQFVFTDGAAQRCQTQMSAGTLTITVPGKAQERGWTVMCRDRSADDSNWDSSLCPIPSPEPSTAGQSDGWVDCKKVKVCGVAPVADGTWVTNTQLVVNYPPLTWACVAEVEVQAFDSALNMSNIPTSVNTVAFGTPECRQTCWDNSVVCQGEPCPPQTNSGGGNSGGIGDGGDGSPGVDGGDNPGGGGTGNDGGGATDGGDGGW